MSTIRIINEDVKLNINAGVLNALIFVTYRIGNRIFLCEGITRKLLIPVYFFVYVIHRILSLLVGCSVPFSAVLGRRIKFQHGFYGIFISSLAVIEDDCVILHQVTIGSNINGEKNKVLGAPKICTGTFIGVGAKIIGPIKVGRHSKIGANCLVVKDVPDFCICVSAMARCIPLKK